MKRRVRKPSFIKVKRADFAVIVTRTHDQWNSAPLDAIASQSATTTNAQLAQRDLVLAAPNPFTDRTRFSYNLTEAGAVSLEVFDMMGRKVSVLENSFKKVGIQQLALRTGSLSAGTYLVRVQVGDKVATRRVTL